MTVSWALGSVSVQFFLPLGMTWLQPGLVVADFCDHRRWFPPSAVVLDHGWVGALVSGPSGLLACAVGSDFLTPLVGIFPSFLSCLTTVILRTWFGSVHRPHYLSLGLCSICMSSLSATTTLSVNRVVNRWRFKRGGPGRQWGSANDTQLALSETRGQGPLASSLACASF